MYLLEVFCIRFSFTRSNICFPLLLARSHLYMLLVCLFEIWFFSFLPFRSKWRVSFLSCMHVLLTKMSFRFEVRISYPLFCNFCRHVFFLFRSYQSSFAHVLWSGEIAIGYCFVNCHWIFLCNRTNCHWILFCNREEFAIGYCRFGVEVNFVMWSRYRCHLCLAL